MREKNTKRQNTKLDWREDLAKRRAQRKKADEAAEKAVQKAELLAERQEEAENNSIIMVVRSLEITPEQLDDFLNGKPQNGERMGHHDAALTENRVKSSESDPNPMGNGVNEGEADDGE